MDDDEELVVLGFDDKVSVTTVNNDDDAGSTVGLFTSFINDDNGDGTDGSAWISEIIASRKTDKGTSLSIYVRTARHAVISGIPSSYTDAVMVNGAKKSEEEDEVTVFVEDDDDDDDDDDGKHWQRWANKYI